MSVGALQHKIDSHVFAGERHVSMEKVKQLFGIELVTVSRFLSTPSNNQAQRVYEEDLQRNWIGKVQRTTACNCQFNQKFKPYKCNDDHCLNRSRQVECIPECGTYCKNRAFSNNKCTKKVRLVARGRRIGVMLLEQVQLGEAVMEFLGRISRVQDDPDRNKNGQIVTLVKDAAYHLVINASQIGNTCSFIQHSCSPTCECRTVYADGRLRVGIYALRQLQYGEDITLDYGEFFTHSIAVKYPDADFGCPTEKCAYYDKYVASLPIAPDRPLQLPSTNYRPSSPYRHRSRRENTEYVKKFCQPQVTYNIQEEDDYYSEDDTTPIASPGGDIEVVNLCSSSSPSPPPFVSRTRAPNIAPQPYLYYDSSSPEAGWPTPHTPNYPPPPSPYGPQYESSPEPSPFCPASPQTSPRICSPNTSPTYRHPPQNSPSPCSPGFFPSPRRFHPPSHSPSPDLPQSDVPIARTHIVQDDEQPGPSVGRNNCTPAWVFPNQQGAARFDLDTGVQSETPGGAIRFAEPLHFTEAPSNQSSSQGREERRRLTPRPNTVPGEKRTRDSNDGRSCARSSKRPKGAAEVTREDTDCCDACVQAACPEHQATQTRSLDSIREEENLPCTPPPTSRVIKIPLAVAAPRKKAPVTRITRRTEKTSCSQEVSNPPVSCSSPQSRSTSQPPRKSAIPASTAVPVRPCSADAPPRPVQKARRTGKVPLPTTRGLTGLCGPKKRSKTKVSKNKEPFQKSNKGPELTWQKGIRCGCEDKGEWLHKGNWTKHMNSGIHQGRGFDPAMLQFYDQRDPFICEERGCNYSTRDPQDFREHAETHKPMSERITWECPVCHEEFTRRRDVTRHRKRFAKDCYKPEHRHLSPVRMVPFHRIDEVRRRDAEGAEEDDDPDNNETMMDDEDEDL